MKNQRVMRRNPEREIVRAIDRATLHVYQADVETLEERRLFAVAPGGPVVFHEAFEQSAMDLWLNNKKGTDRIAVVDGTASVPARAGSKVGKFQLAAGQQRSELYLDPEIAGAERWYGFSMFVPADYATDPFHDIVAQWHEVPDWNLGEDWRVPPLYLAMRNGAWQVSSRWDSRPVNTDSWSPPAPYGGRKDYSSPLAKGVWTDWVFHVKWSYQQNGLLEVYKDGVKIINQVGPNTFNDKVGNFLKVGIYHPDYKIDTNPVTQLKVLYHDEIRVGGASATLASMSPGAQQQQGAVALTNQPLAAAAALPMAAAAAPIKINFQPADAPLVAGNLVDSGGLFGSKGALTYGWNLLHTNAVVDRNINSDQRLDTNLSVKAGGKWEVAVPNGQYTVKLGVGDSATPSQNNVWVEGVNVLSYQSLAANTFASKTTTVNVSDGRLTIGIGSVKSGITRLNYLDITPAGSTPTVPVPPTPPQSAAGTPTKINFQPANAAAVAGYLIDAGALYGNRGTRTYGWNISHAASVVDRNKNADQRLDTNVSVKATGKWELAVPNGQYTVKVAVGDAGAATQNNVWVEGINVLKYQWLGANSFTSKTTIVNVVDGKLTIGIGSAAGGITKLDYVEVTPATSVPPVPPPPVSPPPPPGPPPPPAPFGEWNFNFQPANSAQTSYIVDSGNTFSSQNGLEYGWSNWHGDAVFDRGIKSEQRIDTNVVVKAGSKWEFALPNGRYTVRVGLGDAAYVSNNIVRLEGISLYKNQILSIDTYTSNCMTVDVFDGKLTLDTGSSPTGQTRINYLQIISGETRPVWA